MQKPGKIYFKENCSIHEKAMKDNVDELILKIEKLIDLLDKFHIDFWSSRFKESLRMINNRDFHGIELILSCFGGMGSFNDLVISKYNGDNIKEENEDSINKELKKLSNEIYTLANNIKRDFLK